MLKRISSPCLATAVVALVVGFCSPGLASESGATPTVTADTETAAEATAAPEAEAGTQPEAAPAKQRGSSKSSSSKGSPVRAYYKKGLRIEAEDGSFAARIRWRAQMRVFDLTSDDLVGEEDGVEEETGFRIRRARFKLDGHAYADWLKYYLEYGIAGNILLTWQFDFDKYEKANFRVGQYKIVYNRERVDSSGKQQFVDRSIVNSPFTIDRQQGFHVAGRLFKNSRADSRYVVGVFTGTGRGGGLDEDGRPMYVGRWQWNFLGRDVPFSQSDVKQTPKTIASLAVAGASNVGEFTRWSSSGGGQLPGFSPGAPDQYKTEQWMAEFALLRQGLSIQSEYHFKEVDDRVNNEVTELDGMYAQVGYFFHQLFPNFPENLELAYRWARVDSEAGIPVPADRENSFVVNWFFANHDNKLSFDVSRLESTLFGGSEDDGYRARLQWDVSF